MMIGFEWKQKLCIVACGLVFSTSVAELCKVEGTLYDAWNMIS